MRIIQLQVPDSAYPVGLIQVLPRVRDEQIREAHRKYTAYHDLQTSTDNLDPLSFDEWAKVNFPELGLVVLSPDTLMVTENVI